MIYIFEDRFERKNNNEGTINKYPGKVCFAKFDIDPQQSLAEYIIDNFHDAECMLFHKSYSFKDKETNLAKIQSILTNGYGVKFVIFSGGIERGHINNSKVANINADVMYNNLDHFLNHYNHTNELLFEILIWGENYRLNQFLSLQNALFCEFIKHDIDLNCIISSDLLDDIIFNLGAFNPTNYGIDSLLENAKSERNGSLTGYDLLQLIQSEVNKLSSEL